MQDVRKVFQAYSEAWNVAFETKSDQQIRKFMSRDFRGTWGRSGLDVPEFYDYNYDIVGVLKQYQTAHKSFELIDMSERSNGAEVILIGTETNLVNGETFQAKAMLIWRNEDGEWKLLREYIELTR